MSNALQHGLISEDRIRQSLTFARGDIFVAASHLGVRPSQLDGYIRLSPDLQFFVTIIDKVKVDTEYERISTQQFAERLADLTRDGKLVGMEVVRQLAEMPFDSAAMAEVKLRAAVQLMSVGPKDEVQSGQSGLLAELNQIYQQSAPHIKSLRAAVQVEFEHQEGPVIVRQS